MACRIADAFELNDAELGELFGVPEQTAAGWLTTGVPADHRPKADTILAIAELLDHYILADRIADIARRPARAYGGRTMLQMIATDEHGAMFNRVRASVDFGTTA